MERHRDNIGVLRLIFASLVIIGHAPEMVDGDRHREPLHQIFSGLTLGTVSADAFFLLSGFLISLSFDRQASLRAFLERRVLRIYPAFIVAYLLCVFVVAPIVGAQPWHPFPEMLGRLVALAPPMDSPTPLAGLQHRTVNGAMWTIAYEFRCYLLVALLGSLGLLKRRWAIATATALLLALAFGASYPGVHEPLQALGAHHRLGLLIGEPISDIRLTGAFLVGCCAYLFKDALLRSTRGVTVLLAAACALLCSSNPHLAETGVIVFGGYGLFWLAFRAPLGRIQSINDSWDISYGTYLYGWPIATLLIFLLHPSPWILAAVTLPLAWTAGWASWVVVERRAKDAVIGRRADPGAGLSLPSA